MPTDPQKTRGFPPKEGSKITAPFTVGVPLGTPPAVLYWQAVTIDPLNPATPYEVSDVASTPVF